VQTVLRHVLALLEHPTEALTKARDRNLAALSSLLRHAHALLAAIMAPHRAARNVIVVQRSLVMAMLSATTFNLQLAGVREINAMLEAAQPPPKRVASVLMGPSLPGEEDAGMGGSGAGSATADENEAGALENVGLALSWLEHEGVLARALRSHLHLKQYCEQVERIMRFLLRHRCLRDEHLDVVWSATEKADTFEETKANMFALLAALAPDFSPAQLDALFARFEHARGRSAADTVKILGLITALARGDAGGVLAERLTDLLWAQARAPEAPPEALSTLNDVVSLYASSAPGCRSTLVARCLDSIRAGVGVVPSVRLLRCLLAAPPAALEAAAAAAAAITEAEDTAAAHAAATQAVLAATRDAMRELNAQHGVIGLILGELEAYMAGARAAVAAGAPSPPGDGRFTHTDCLQERMNFLLSFLGSADIGLDVPAVDRMWGCLVAGAALPSDADVFASWLYQASQAATNGQVQLAPELARHVLRRMGGVPPEALTRNMWACFAYLVAVVGTQAGQMRRLSAEEVSAFQMAHTRAGALARLAHNSGVLPANTLAFEGLTQIWDIALNGSPIVSAEAMVWLAWLYPQLSGPDAGATQALRQALLRQAEARLNAAATELSAAAAAGSGSAIAAAMAARRAERVLRVLDTILVQVDAAHHAASHAAGVAPPVHAATFRGRVVEVELQFNTKVITRIKVQAPGNQYASELRAIAAAHVGVPASRLRLFASGKELCSMPEHAQLPCHFLDGNVINVALLPEPLVHTATPPIITTGAALLTAATDADAAADSDTPAMDTEGPAPADVAGPASQPPPSTPVAPSVIAGNAAATAQDTQSARQLLAAMPGLYDTLFALADAGHASLCNRTTALLGALPTRGEAREHLASLLGAGVSGADAAAAAADARRKLADVLRAPPAARAYALQVLESLLLPVNRFVDDTAAAAAQAAFLALGGPELVLAALMPATLPPHTGAVPLRGLFMSGLSLLRLPATDGDATMTPPAQTPMREFVEVDSVDSAADRFASDTVEALLWLLPRTAMGRLGDAALMSAASAAAAAAASGDDDGALGGGGSSLSALAAAVNGDGSASVDANDQYLTFQGLLLLTHALGQRPGGVSRLLARPDAPLVLTDLLLRCPVPALRERAATMCVDLVGRDACAVPAPAPSPAPSPSRRAPGATSSGPAAMSGSGGSGGMAATGGAAPPSSSSCEEVAAAQAAAAIARRALLEVLLAARPIADESPTTCGSYFELTASLLLGCATAGVDGPALESLLVEEVRTLAAAPPCSDPTDGRLEGHLGLVLALVRGLGRRTVLTPSGVPLLKLLLTRFLFPELAVLRREEGAAPLVVSDAAEDDAALLTAIASTPRTRAAAFALITALATHNADALADVVSTLRRLHFRTPAPPAASADGAAAGGSAAVVASAPSFFGGALWERTPQYAPRRADGFVGLGNGGATCYMNSVFQQLFMQPAIRRGVLAAEDAGDGDPAESVLCQLQATFGALHASRLDHHRPESFWRAFKDYDGQPVNVREHQDALEFLTRLQEQFDSSMKKAKPAGDAAAMSASGDAASAAPTAPAAQGALEGVLGGVLVNQMLCRACPQHRSEKDESFTSLAVDIRNKSGLLESLAAYVQGELLEGDNQWVCEACGRKVDAVKRQTVKTLPQTLCIQLKRFEYDYETMQRLKARPVSAACLLACCPCCTEFGHRLTHCLSRLLLPSFPVQTHQVKDRFEFPTELDMRPFTREGVDEVASPPAADGASGSSATVPPARDSADAEKYGYTLMGVVVHSGSAFAGHYYSYIRERVEAADGRVSAGAWHVFDDKRVEPYDASCLERDTFGGRYSTDVWDPSRKMHVAMDYDRPNSAYMLFYERLGGGGAGVDGSASAPSGSPGPDGDVAMDGGGGSAGFALPPPVRLPARVAAEVRAANAQCVYEAHLLSRDYFSFVRGLVDANSEGDSRKRRREAPAAAQAAAAAAAAAVGMPPAPMADALCCELAAEFLLNVYSRAATSLRDDGAQWAATLGGLLESSRAACAWFLHWLVDQDRHAQLRAVLTRAPGEDVRQLWSRLCVSALRAAVGHDEAAGEYSTLATCCEADQDDSGPEGPGPNDLPGLVHALVATLIGFVDAMAAARTKVESSALAPLGVLCEYAKLGPDQRAHLVLCDAPGVLAQFAVAKLGSFSPPRLDNMGAVGHAVHATLSLIFRGAVRLRVPRALQRSPPMPLTCALSRSPLVTHAQGGSYFHAGRAAPQLTPNAFALPGGTGSTPSMYKRLYDVVIRQHGDKYLPLLVDASMAIPEARELLCYLCWDAGPVSRNTMQVLLNELHNTPVDDGLLAGLLLCVEALLSMADSIAPIRAALFVSGRVAPAPAPGAGTDALLPVGGFVDTLGSHMVPLQKRWVLLKWATALADSHAAPHFLQRILDAHEVQWHHAIDAIQDEIDRQAHVAPYGADANLAACYPVLEHARDLVTL
jgi:ubiquitin C-terminal hydrolase